jgi:hypothetical protein
MRADIHDGQEHKRSVQGPDTEAQDLSPPNHHFPLATRGRSIQKCQELPWGGKKISPNLRSARLMGSALADEAYGNHPANSSAESPG